MNFVIKEERSIEELLVKIHHSTKPIVIDTETTGLNIRKDEVIGIGLAFAEFDYESYYIPLYFWNTIRFDGRGMLEEFPWYDRIKDVLEALKDKKLIFHNALFDLQMIKNDLGVDLWPNLYADTIMLVHTLQEEGPFGLKTLAKGLWGIEELEEQQKMKASIKANGGSANEFFKADWTLLGEYCAKDCELTYKLFNHFEPKLDEDNLREFFYDKEVMPLYKTVTRTMVENGIPLDMELLKQSKIEIEKDLEELEDKIQANIKSILGHKFTNWFLAKEYEVKKSGNFAQALCKYADLKLPKLDSGKYSLAAKGVLALPESRFKDFLQHEIELPEEDVIAIRTLMLEEEGLKYPLNLRSKQHLGRVFFSFLKEKPISFTPHGTPQVDEDTLDILAEKYEWVKELVTFNKLTKIHGTYVERFLKEQEKGIFYPEWKQFGTTSSRFSGDMQQLPRALEEEEEEEEGIVAKYTNRVRNFFKAQDGWKFVDADYSSLEIGVFADDCGEEKLTDMIRNKLDFYSYMAIQVWGLQDKYSADKGADNFLKKHRPDLRQQAKGFSLGIRYGLEAFKLSKDLKISQEEAEGIVHQYFTTFPKLKERMEQLKWEAAKTGKVVFKSGRIRHLPEVKGFHEKYGLQMLNSLELWKEYHETDIYEEMKKLRRKVASLVNNAYNSPIQGFAAFIVNQASIAIMKQFKDLGMEAYICGQIHDEILIHCPEKEVDKVKEIMQRCMEDTTKLSIPLEAKPNVGERYGDVK